LSTKQIIFCQAIEARRSLNTSLTDSFQQAMIQAELDSGPGFYYQKLLDVCQDMVDIVEKDGIKKAESQGEPAYHNRQHFADTCLALSFFLKDAYSLSQYQKLLLLLTTLVHDYGHRGILTKPTGRTHEEQTIKLLINTSIYKLNEPDYSLINELIIGTSPASLNRVNARHIEEPFNQKNLMQSLINDADIAASFIDTLAPSLSKLILIEAGNGNPNKAEIRGAIQHFKVNFKITTSIAKSYLI
jgi:hypothetical protein